MVQVGVGTNHVINVYSRPLIGSTHRLQVIDKELGESQNATINSVTFSNGLVTIDFDYVTSEASQYYVIFSSLDSTYKERFKSMVFATAQTTKTPYQNTTANNNIV